MTICNEVDCKKQGKYNTEGQSNGKYCGTHRRDGMINVTSKTCLECNKQPYYNTEGLKIGIYCKEHKLEGMNDVKNKKCLECNTIPHYNTEGLKIGIYCKTHKLEGMINVTSKTCIECNTIPKYNTEGLKTGLYCKEHKKDGMVDVLHKRCNTHLCDTIVINNNNKYKGYCLRCFIHTFPDEPVSRNYKTKERVVVEYVLKEFPDISWICDKTVPDGCSLRRPDLNGDIGTHVIMGEVDENQHTNYDSSCENKRTMELSQDVGHRPIVFIRFNPDGYTDTNGKKITSCWGVNKLGILVVKPSKISEWKARISVFHDQIRYWVDNVPDKTIEVIQLFY